MNVIAVYKFVQFPSLAKRPECGHEPINSACKKSMTRSTFDAPGLAIVGDSSFEVESDGAALSLVLHHFAEGDARSIVATDVRAV